MKKDSFKSQLVVAILYPLIYGFIIPWISAKLYEVYRNDLVIRTGNASFFIIRLLLYIFCGFIAVLFVMMIHNNSRFWLMLLISVCIYLGAVGVLAIAYDIILYTTSFQILFGIFSGVILTSIIVYFYEKLRKAGIPK